MPQRYFILLCCAVLAWGASQVTIHPRPAQRIPGKTIVKERVIERPKTVKIRVHDKQPDGYMREEQCQNLAKGTDFRDLIWQYGWPAGDDGTDSYAGFLNYPLREDHDRVCSIDTFGGEVTNVRVEL